MITIESEIKDRLVDNGLFPDDADRVISAMKADEANEAMANRWNDSPEGYPPQIMAIAWLSARHHALSWIDANLPLAWYRSLFT
jgi:hypothetical protein